MLHAGPQLRFGTLYHVMDSQGHAQKVKADSIYDLEKTDPTIIKELSDLADKVDQATHPTQCHQHEEHAADIKPFVSHHEVYIATGKESERINAYFVPRMQVGAYGFSNAERLLRRLESACAAVMGTEALSKADTVTFRNIIETVREQVPWLARIGGWLGKNQPPAAKPPATAAG